MTRRLTEAAPWLLLTLGAALLYLLTSCGGEPAPVAGSALAEAVATTPTTTAPTATARTGTGIGFELPDGNPESLDAWGQLTVVDESLTLADGVVAYDLNSELFSDYAHKLRTVRLPDGAEPASYRRDDVFDFPVGTVITKTFYYPLADRGNTRVAKRPAADLDLGQPLALVDLRLIETRVLARRADGWSVFPYVWNDEQTEATLSRTGDLQMLTLVDDVGQTETEFPYVVPNVNQCASCHAVNHTTGVIQPIGPKARHLDRTVLVNGTSGNQLDQWRATGLLGAAGTDTADASAVWDDESAPLDARARAYLDINCAHCHNSVGPADTSGLFLEPSTDIGPSLGVCKLPIAAGTGTGGRRVGIFPGAPSESIFVYRMETNDPGAMMPEVGRALTHTEGVDLITTWIASLDGGC